MTSKIFTILLSVVAIAGSLNGADSSRPNIIFLMVDDLGWTDFGCYGSDYYETPHIDKFASSGMKFTNGYAACTVCSPTRASLMTGNNPLSPP
tara:strand:+ start:651 stop:929 length:279 start_codon:yes stop_codon:yes gene_type:complete